MPSEVSIVRECRTFCFAARCPCPPCNQAGQGEKLLCRDRLGLTASPSLLHPMSRKKPAGQERRGAAQGTIAVLRREEAEWS